MENQMSVSDLQRNQINGRLSIGVPRDSVEKFMEGDSENIVGREFNKNTANLKAALKAFDAASETLFEASDRMHAQADSLNSRAKASVARAKDMAAQMTDAMNRITKMLGGDFEQRLVQLERLADAMERLSELQAKGQLAGVISALQK